VGFFLELAVTTAYDQARRHLSRRDKALRAVIRRVGSCTLQHDPDHFGVLARSIIAQQISSKAAIAISQRVLKAIKKLTPRRLLATDEATLRAAGLSANKQKSLRDLAEKCLDRSVPLQRLADLPDEDVIEALIPVRGIGRWTAEMFLIFSLGRMDVLPVGDFGLRAGAKKLYALPDLPGKDELTRLAEPWQPYRTIGTWYVWRSLGNVPQSD